ncbi:MAG TPA: hypothetical protein DD730_15145 [Desulfosporosinus sp.]|nr:hypothetical protein [Desulfosporosinus sp.]
MPYREFFQNCSPNAKVFLLMSFITTLSTGAFTMLFGIVVLQLGRSESFLGQILAIGLLATGVLSLPVGILADLWGKKRTLLLALGLTGTGLLPLVLQWPVSWEWLRILVELQVQYLEGG